MSPIKSKSSNIVTRVDMLKLTSHCADCDTRSFKQLATCTTHTYSSSWKHRSSAPTISSAEFRSYSPFHVSDERLLLPQQCMSGLLGFRENDG